MKLIYCPECDDVVKLGSRVRFCQCKASRGYYLSGGNAVYFGEAVPLGFANSTLIAALKNQPEKGLGERFRAFVVPKSCPTFRKV